MPTILGVNFGHDSLFEGATNPGEARPKNSWENFTEEIR